MFVYILNQQDYNEAIETWEKNRTWTLNSISVSSRDLIQFPSCYLCDIKVSLINLHMNLREVNSLFA